MKRKIDLIVLFIIILIIIVGFIDSRMQKIPNESSKSAQTPSAPQLHGKSSEKIPKGAINKVPGIRIPQKNQ
jgi:hypothetical protein